MAGWGFGCLDGGVSGWMSVLVAGWLGGKSLNSSTEYLLLIGVAKIDSRVARVAEKVA